MSSAQSEEKQFSNDPWNPWAEYDRMDAELRAQQARDEKQIECEKRANAQLIWDALKERFEEAYRGFNVNPTTHNRDKVEDAWEAFSKISYRPFDHDTDEYFVSVMIRITKLGNGNHYNSVVRRVNVYQDNEEDGCLGGMDMGPHRTAVLDEKNNPVSGHTVSCEDGSTIIMLPPNAMVCSHTRRPHRYSDTCETARADEVMGILTDHTISEMLLALLRRTPAKSFRAVVITLTVWLAQVVNMFERGFIPMLADNSYCQDR